MNSFSVSSNWQWQSLVISTKISYDFSMIPENQNIDIPNTLCLENLINETSCFKSAINHLILTNKKSLFMKLRTFERSLFHKITITII